MNYSVSSGMRLGVMDDEQWMLQKKYAAKQIGLMDEKEMSLWPKALLLKIHVITGWVIPATELLNILVDQFQKKLLEDYWNLNTEEIEYAFRRSGTTIKDWGKEMNLNLIDQVLIPYLQERIEASQNEEKRKRPPEQKIYTDAEIRNQRRGHLETAYQVMRIGRMPLIFPYYADVLIQDGFIEKSEDMDQFFSDCLEKGIENLYIKEN